MGQWPMDNTIGATNSLFLSQTAGEFRSHGRKAGVPTPNSGAQTTTAHFFDIGAVLLWVQGFRLCGPSARVFGMSNWFQGFFALPK